MNKLRIKSLIGFIGATALMLVGVYLWVNAEAIAKPKGDFITWGDPPWAHRAIIVSDIGVTLAAVGILMLLITYTHWLFAKPSEK